MNKLSLREYLPDLPYHPDKFKSSLTPDQKWLWDWEEPYKEYQSAYEVPCPKCGSFELIMDSSRELELSHISCMDCDWTVQESLCEEDLLDKFNSGFYIYIPEA